MKKLVILITLCLGFSMCLTPIYASESNSDDETMFLVGVFDVNETKTQQVEITTPKGNSMVITVEDIPVASTYETSTDYVGTGSFKKKITVDEKSYKMVGVFTGYRTPYIARFDDVLLNDSYMTSIGMSFVKDTKLINNNISSTKAEARYIVTYTLLGGTHRMHLIAQLDAPSGRLFAFTNGEF